MEKSFYLSDEMRLEFYSFNTIRHQNTKLPPEAYFYIPRGKDLIEYDEKNMTKTIRRIFEGGVEYTLFEINKLSELKEHILRHNHKSKNNKKLIFPDNWKDSDTLRFLQENNFVVPKTLKLILKHLEWKSACILELYEKEMQILNLGFIYIHGRDSYFRPIINIRAEIFEKYKSDFIYEEWERAVIYLMEYTVKNLLLRGQIENYIIICDFKGISVNSIHDDLKRILSILQDYYKYRLFIMYIIKIGGLVQVWWNAIKKLIDHSLEKKIIILKSEKLHNMFSIINQTQVEKKIGGTANNIHKYYFPPIFPSNEYLIENQNKEYVFLDEKIYRSYIKIHKDLAPSPYLKEESVENINEIMYKSNNKFNDNSHSDDQFIVNDEYVNQINNDDSTVKDNVKDDNTNTSDSINISNGSYDINSSNDINSNKAKSCIPIIPKYKRSNICLSFENDLFQERKIAESNKRLKKLTIEQNCSYLKMDILNKNIQNCPIFTKTRNLQNNFNEDFSNNESEGFKSINKASSTFVCTSNNLTKRDLENFKTTTIISKGLNSIHEKYIEKAKYNKMYLQGDQGDQIEEFINDNYNEFYENENDNYDNFGNDKDFNIKVECETRKTCCKVKVENCFII